MRFQEDADGLITELRSMLGAIGKDEFVPSWLRKSAMHLAHARDLGRNLVLHPNGGLILHSRWLFPDVEEDVELFSDDTDISASGTVNQSLETHLDGVGTWARIFAEGCGLEPPLVEAIELAARAHDLGKVDPRFQVWLRGGTRVMGGPLLAKSQDLPRDRRSLIRARELAGYPKGGRHELLSQRLLESARPTQYEPELLDLVWHLVESHHGRCRPFAPVIHDDAAPAIDVTWQEQQLSHRGPIGLEQIDSGVAERYWRLTRRYGWWGLAWLEAILRLADHRQSEWEELHR
jgi:CRISPR-associated endonuclease/helicase Cas3